MIAITSSRLSYGLYDSSNLEVLFKSYEASLDGKQVLHITPLPKNSTEELTSFLVRALNTSTGMIEILRMDVSHQSLLALLKNREDAAIASNVTMI